MAGDWIKIRAALLSHPKVIAASRSLHDSKEFREWLLPGGSGQTNGQLISNAALRCVTTALLTKVWSVSREHGEFVGNDLVLRHSKLSDIDDMAGAPGVGMAMNSVGWAYEDNGVTLPNFKEFNVPMSPAEKQSEYRKRNTLSNGVVTKLLPSQSNESAKNVTTRVEREETKNKDKPIAPPSALPALPTSKSFPAKPNTTPVERTTGKGTRLQVEKLSTDWAEFCKAERPDLDPVKTFDQFHDFWIARPGQAGIKLDWLATWRNWVRKEQPGKKTNGNGQADDWWRSDQGVERKGAEFGLKPNPGESMSNFKDRVQSRANEARVA